MKRTIVTAGIAIATLFAPFGAQAAEADSAKTMVKDSVITTKIKAKLAGEKMSTLTHLTVDTDSKGEVVLSGNLKSQAEVDKAVAIARGTEGVTSVVSKVTIK